MNTYNGWRNYATWRINLEIFDDDYQIIEMLTGGASDLEDAAEMLDGENLQSFADEIIFGEVGNPANEKHLGLLVSYANAFLDEVDWDQISEALIETLNDDPEQFGFEVEGDE